MDYYNLLNTQYKNTKELKNFVKEKDRFINSVFYFNEFISILDLYEVNLREELDELNIITNIVELRPHDLNENDLINFFRNHITQNISNYITNYKKPQATTQNLQALIENKENYNWIAGNSSTLNKLSNANISSFYLPTKDNICIVGHKKENTLGINFYPIKTDLVILQNGSIKAITQYILKIKNKDLFDIISFY